MVNVNQIFLAGSRKKTGPGYPFQVLARSSAFALLPAPGFPLLSLPGEAQRSRGLPDGTQRSLICPPGLFNKFVN